MRKCSKRIYLAAVVLLFVLVLFPLLTSSADLQAQSFPAIYNQGVLNDIKNNPHGYPQLDAFLKKADGILAQKPLSVIDKKKTFAPNKHFYCSISRYSWPDPNNPNGPYIIKDGINNPEYADYDGTALETLAERLQYLCVAYYLTGRAAYRRAVSKQLNVWFLDKKTRMKPNFEYAQVQPGYNDNKGQSYGLAELSRFTKIVESLMLFDCAQGLSKKERRKLKAWFSDFQDWLLNSRQWHIISKANNNNITSSGYLALVEMSLFTGDTRVASQLAGEYKERVIEKQIEDDGKQPAELKRADGFGYSVGNLEEIIDFCLVMENMGSHFYKENQNKIDAAFGYLYQFVNNHEAFPYQQNASWGFYEKRLLKNMKRLSRFSVNDTNIETKAEQIELKDSPILNLVY
jgi:hypothetical protein